MKLHFTKMHGLGNDFVVIDAVNQSFTPTPAIMTALADRHFGIGCDQLLLVEPATSANADFAYRIFNADGSEVYQCGNGARCFARFVREKQLSDKNEILVDTGAGQLLLKFTENDLITVNMGVPRLDPKSIPLLAEREQTHYNVEIAKQNVKFSAISIGNPHAVIEVDDITTAQVDKIGPLLENHRIFPQRANIGFMQIIDRQMIKLRVYERGAAETLACGSGACAAAVAAMQQGRVDDNIAVHLPGGQLHIVWQGHGQPVFMTGPAMTVFEGHVQLPVT